MSLFSKTSWFQIRDVKEKKGKEERKKGNTEVKSYFSLKKDRDFPEESKIENKKEG